MTSAAAGRMRLPQHSMHCKQGSPLLLWLPFLQVEKPVRHNPRSDKFEVQQFHHVEFWTADATASAKRYQLVQTSHQPHVCLKYYEHCLHARAERRLSQKEGHIEPCVLFGRRRFSWGLGMAMVAKSDQATRNSTFASYVLQSGELVFALTAPYSRANRKAGAPPPLPWYDQDKAYSFLNQHGLAVRAIGTHFHPVCFCGFVPSSALCLKVRW